MFREVKRFVLDRPRFAAAVGIFVISGAGWMVTNASLSRRVKEGEERVKRMGYPVAVEELNRPWLPDDSNPAVVILEAADIVEKYVDKNDLASDRTLTSYPFDKVWLKDALAAEAALGAAMETAHQAAQRPAGHLNVVYKSPLLDHLLTNLNESKVIANAIRDSAYLHNIQGDPVKALERTLDLRAIPENMVDDWCLVTHLVYMAEWSMMAETAITLGVTLKAEDLPETRGKIVQLIAALLDEAEREKGVHKAFAVERLFFAEIGRALFKDARVTHATIPGIELYATRVHGNIEKVLNSSDWRGEGKKLAAVNGWAPNVSLDDLRYPLLNLGVTLPGTASFNGIERHYRGIAETRAAAVALAAHLYRMEHEGRWPGSQEELVPKYLPAVQMDPYYAEPTPMEIRVIAGAKPDGTDRPVVAFNQREKELGPNPREPSHWWESRNSDEPIRQYRDLTWFEKVRSPNKKALPAVPHEPDEAGDEDEPEAGAPEVDPQ